MAVLVCLCSSAFAGTVFGTVTVNQYGQADGLCGATVSVLDSGRNTLTGLADASGNYEIDGLLSGQAEVTCRSDQGVFVGRKSITVDQSTPAEADFDWSIVASAAPFVPTGANSVTLSTTYNPGTTGLAIWVNYTDAVLPLTENPANSGCYSVQCDALWNDVIWPDDNFELILVDSSGYPLPTSGRLAVAGTFVVTGVSDIYLGTLSFDPHKEGLSIRVDAASGLGLQIQIFQNGGEVRTLSLTETSTGVYDAI